MIDHISLRVNDFDKAVNFYKAALKPLGYDVLMQFPGAAGLGGPDKKPDFWIMKSDQPLNPTHLAFSADRKTVDAFHAAAIAAGGTDHGAPGLRTDYHPNYYGAFVLDPEGNNVEAVSHSAGKPAKEPAKKRAVAKPKNAAKPKAKKKAKPTPKSKAKPKIKKVAKPKAKKTAAKPKAKKTAAKPKAKKVAKVKGKK
jgi:catechol 2,3-dioxygenase-like lactoylglutathione lyase family enzyme